MTRNIKIKVVFKTLDVRYVPIKKYIQIKKINPATCEMSCQSADTSQVQWCWGFIKEKM